MNRKSLLVFSAITCVLPFLGFQLYGLLDLDEGFYAAVVREMNRRGEWITPYFNGHPWFEKPILLYWLAKPCVALFPTEFGARLPSVLCSLGTCAVVAWFGHRFLKASAGVVSAMVLATSLLFVAVGRMMLVDPLLVLCLTGVFTTFWASLVAGSGYRVGSLALLGFAVLAKGPVSLVFFVAVAGWTFWREPDLRPNFRGGWLLGWAAFILVVSSWYVPAYLINRDVFIQKFFIEQNINRFKGGDEAHAVHGIASLVYYLPIILMGMAPWSAFLWRAWPRAGSASPVTRYTATWAVVVFGFFTMSGTKLPTYVLPCFPPLALLVGQDLAARWNGVVTSRRMVDFGGGAAILGAFVSVVFAAYYQSFHAQLFRVINLVQDDSRKTPGRSVATFRLTRQPDGTALPLPKPRLFRSIPIGLNETSHPSILFYLNRTVPETDSVNDLFALPMPVDVISRPGRLREADSAAIRAAGLEWRATLETPLYGLYRLQKAPSQAGAPMQK